jgi:tetratricopeptide (TPR) repeat protein
MRALRHRCAVALLLALAPAIAFAQNQARMSGVVTDHEGKGVKDAVVRLAPTSEDGTAIQAKSKKNGAYLIGLIRPGSYKLEVVAPNGLVVLGIEGRAIDLANNKNVLWEVDTEITEDKIPPINVGYMNQIELNITVGPPSMTAEARAKAAADEMQSSYASGLEKVKSGDYLGALADLEPLLAETPEHAGTNYLVAYAKFHVDRHAEALPLVDRALAADPGFVGAHVLRGRILGALGRTEEAEKEFQAEIAGSTDAGVKTEALVALAMLYERTDRLPDAIGTLEKAAETDPRREILLGLSDLYMKAGDRAKAEATLERAEQAGGMDDVAWLNLAIGYINEKNYDQAERLASRLVEKGASNANLSMAHSVLARCDLSRGKLDDGAAHLRKALELDPKSPLAEENREILSALKR